MYSSVVVRAISFPITLPGCLGIETRTITVGVTEPKLSGQVCKGSKFSVTQHYAVASSTLWENNDAWAKWKGTPATILLNSLFNKTRVHLYMGVVLHPECLLNCDWELPGKRQSAKVNTNRDKSDKVISDNSVYTQKPSLPLFKFLEWTPCETMFSPYF